MQHDKPNVVIIIPTYWTWGSERADGPVTVIYDHSTPLDGESTLPRLLESLSALEGPQFSVLILTAATHPELEQAVDNRVDSLITPFRAHYPIAQATEADAALIRKHLLDRLTERSRLSLAENIQMCGYAGVRNLQLLLPHALGAEVIVALDDDEVVASGYLRVATEFIGREHEGKRVLGLAGFYLDADGDVLLPERIHTGNIFLDKSSIMNNGVRALQAAPGRLVPTPVAFGGNMVFHRDLFTRVGFDPGITRGEDIDYLINAQLAGNRFWLDKELLITHLPPKPYDTHRYAKLMQDIYRFAYEREKLRLTKVDPAQFDPYPGRFLRDDFADQALDALQAEATPEATVRFGTPDSIVAQARLRAVEIAPRYMEFAGRWPEFMEAVEKDVALRELLLERFEKFD